ncbi:hypothetical protein HGB25_01890 [Candidatus Saccharibacteria bacterium]|nr:hypothetical protein [Candidatus Saccharibacteria bacterium]
MRILAVGGGSGGHVTPVVAVLREIRHQHPRAEMRFWCDMKFSRQAREIVSNFDNKVPVHTVMAGKFRRYHHISFVQQLLMPSIVIRNVRDIVYVVVGLIQSITKLVIWRPGAIFFKGGYVCLPVGIAAHLLRIPYVIHDSDTHPGLTNRVLSKWATQIATGAPIDNYPYPAEKTHYVGIPIAPEFHKFSSEERVLARKKWGIRVDRPLVVVTGGGLGAEPINNVVTGNLDVLLGLGSLVLVSGSGQYDSLRSLVPPNSDRFQLHSFIAKDMALLLGAADVVVSRAGATFILELAAMAKPTILIPNRKLTAGHQLKNATMYEEKGAVVVVDEVAMVSNPDLLVSAIRGLLTDRVKMSAMSDKFEGFARHGAARDVANMVISTARL